MSQPTRSDVHVNRPLTDMSVAYIQKAEDFIADKVFPVVPVMKQSDRYFTYTKSDWFRTQAEVRAPGTESAGSGFHLDNTPTYFAQVYAVHKDIDDQTRTNQDNPVDLDRDSTLYVSQQLLLKKEITFVANYFKASTWTGAADFTPGTLWSAAGGDPIGDVDKKMSAIKSKTGYRPNVFVCSDDVFYVIKNSPAVLDRIKYTQKGVVTAELLAALFGVDKFLVASAVLNTAAEGASDSLDFIVKNKCLLVYAAPAPSIMQPSGGYTFAWKGMYGAGATGSRVSSFRMEHLKSDRIEGEMAYDQKLVGADLGCYMTGLIA